MTIVIIAGGSGTRLWPLSTPERPKHLLKLNGSKKSLLQNTYDRARLLTKNIYVISEAGHIDLVKEQLNKLPEDSFICEPGRRGTANCIISALNHISKKSAKDEVVAFIAADHHVRDSAGFTHSFQIASELTEREKRIVLVGLEPDYPSTGFGYIKKGKLLSDKDFAYNVDSFKEKPDFATAKKYIKSGNYLWNASYFVGQIETFLKAMEDYAPDLYESYNKISKASTTDFNKIYLGLETDSIDYALIEKVPNLLVVPASFDWMDLGSFNDLHKAVGGNKNGNHIQGNVEIFEVENSYLHNDEEKPIAVIGLDNIVVVNSAKGIVISRKDLAQKVGDMAKKLQNL
jgi:mannose-1-phosphate guanylyltransferase/mannose-6-phosphate isomerase